MQQSGFIANVLGLSVAPFVVGLLVALLLGLLVGPFLNMATDGMRYRDGKPLWEHLPSLGRWLGCLEVSVFYLVFLVRAEVFIGAWLVFKLGAKWQSWSGVVKMPDLRTVSFESGSDFETRHRFSSWLLVRFLMGTLANIPVAAAGAVFYSLTA